MMNQFSELYQTLSDTELLRIIHNESDYQLEAVEAAKAEIQKRNLSENELADAKVQLEAERLEKEKQEQQKEQSKQRIKGIQNSIWDRINPMQQTAPSAEKQIRSLSIVFGIMLLMQWYAQSGLIKFVLTEDPSHLDASIFQLFIPQVLLTIGAILFWGRKKFGWILMTIFFTYSTLSSFSFLIILWNYEPGTLFTTHGLPSLSSRSTQVLTTLFFGGILWVLAKNGLREKFNINKMALLATLVMALVVSLLMIGPFLF